MGTLTFENLKVGQKVLINNDKNAYKILAIDGRSLFIKAEGSDAFSFWNYDYTKYASAEFVVGKWYRKRDSTLVYVILDDGVCAYKAKWGAWVLDNRGLGDFEDFDEVDPQDPFGNEEPPF